MWVLFFTVMGLTSKLYSEGFSCCFPGESSRLRALLLPPHLFFRSQPLLCDPEEVHRDLGLVREAGIIFVVVSHPLKKLNYLKVCREMGTKRWMAGRQKDTGWYNATCFSFSFSSPQCLLRWESGISKRAQGSRRQDLVGEENRREAWTRYFFLHLWRENAVSRAADLSFFLCFPSPSGTAALELL